MINNIQTLDIQGVTGRIRFNNGDRIGEIVIEQILGRREKERERLSLACFFMYSFAKFQSGYCEIVCCITDESIEIYSFISKK